MIDPWEAIAWLCITVGGLLIVVVLALTREGDEMFGLLKREPVLAGSLGSVLVTVAATFGLNLTSEQATALIVTGQLIVGLIARMHVTPVAKG